MRSVRKSGSVRKLGFFYKDWGFNFLRLGGVERECFYAIFR